MPLFNWRTEELCVMISNRLAFGKLRLTSQTACEDKLVLGWKVKQKVIEGKYEKAMRDQAWDYADLENELADQRHEDRAACELKM